ncbi:transcription termination factor Rho [Candidatus Nomurabacteria bacterium]|uniref:Transcription termination factor Rho n=1 Tax=candidate division WWE3 bacterium TaxID=2053526 RepID=A0A955E2G8_UNCKA|nr:transcription termination factor Rho [candidate division WWE3 bacterium]MCB9823594.1 transcription termination factor Rho [Candidatus Nomurabacteria bacterium]MCB9827389.1 transcription termination factor Rho [Candidatus Nomurabacteria bacterium]
MPTAKKVHSDRDQIAQKNSDSSINTDGSNGSAVVEAKSLSDSSTSNNPESKNNTSVSKTDQDDVSAVRTTVITTESRNNKSHQSRGRHSSGSSGNNGGNSGTTNSSGNSKFFTGETIKVEGVLELFTDYGVIRQDIADTGDNDLPKDVYTSLSQIKRFSLRMGDLVEGYARAPKEGERYLSLLQIEKVDGLDPSEAKKRPRFSKLTPIFPDEWMKLETAPEILSTRIIDLVSPIGKGQRAMLVAPPKAGKTWLLQDIANGITKNHPEVVLMVALIGERPEEVTDMRRNVNGEVYASNFDQDPADQTRVAEICLEKAKRTAEKGKDVVILMDSLTRLARAYNMVVQPSGRTLTGGFDPSALYPAKRFFGAARNLEEGGSLTIIATALVDTGSRMDDVIFEEFKGTGNMELKLDRALSERRIFPAIDIKSSSTRREDLLYDKNSMEMVHKLRRMIDLLDDKETTDLVLQQLKKSKSNEDFLKTLGQPA